MTGAVTALGDAYTVAAGAVGAYKKSRRLPRPLELRQLVAARHQDGPGAGLRDPVRSPRRSAAYNAGGTGSPPGLAKWPHGDTRHRRHGGGGLLPFGADFGPVGNNLLPPPPAPARP